MKLRAILKLRGIFGRIAAGMLTVFLVLQLGVFIPPAAAAESWENDLDEPTVLYGGVPVYDGVVLTESSRLTVHFEFEATLSELDGAVKHLALPEPLFADSIGAFDITGYDSIGNDYALGEISVNSSGEAQASFAEGLYDGEIPGSGDILVSAAFDISCAIDMDKAPAALEGEPRQFTLLSGGQSVTVEIADADSGGGGGGAPLGAPPMLLGGAADDFGSVVTIDDVVLEKWLVDDYVSVGDDPINGDDSLRLTYEFHITADQVAYLKGLMGSGGVPTYSIPVPMPVGLICTSVGQVPINVGLTINGHYESVQFALLDFTKSGDDYEFYITFTGGFWMLSEDVPITDGFVSIECKLDMEALEGEDQVEIELADGYSVTVNIDNSVPAGSDSITKSGSYDANERTFNWVINYTLGSGYDPDVSGPIVITDINTDNAINPYVEGSFSVESGGHVFVGANYALDYTTTPGTLVCTINSLPDGVGAGDTVKITYQTKLIEDEFTPDNIVNNSNVSNTVYLIATGDTDIELEYTATASAKPSDKKLITKSVKNNPGAPGTDTYNRIDWTVTVYTHSLNFTYFDLYDKIAKYLTLDPDSVLINSDNFTDAPLAFADETVDPETGISVYKFAIPKFAGNYDPVYTITYTTTIDDEYFELLDAGGAIAQLTLENEAWIAYNLPGGPGAGYQTPEPGVNIVGVGVDNHLIQKTGTYDPRTHRITWEVTVNPYKVDVTSGTVTDPIKPGQTYVPGSFDGGSSGHLTLASSSGGTLKVNVGALGKNTAKFTFQTTVDNEQDFAGNNSGATYTNTASFDGYINVPGSGNVHVTDAATAQVPVTSQVLTKSAGDYSYEDNTVEWTVVVNQNRMDMKGAKLIDSIPQYQSLVAGTVTINGAAASPGDVSLTKLTGGVTQMTINLGNITDTVTVKFKTKVDVDSDERFRESDSITLSNNVTLKRTDVAIGVDSAASQQIDNTLLKKSGTYDAGTHKIKYSVEINPNSMDLTYAFNKIELKDTLPDGLILDIEKVSLYEAQATGSSLVKGEKLHHSDFYWAYNTNTNVFTLRIPEAKCYILEYECYVVGPRNTYTNHIEFTGSYISGDSSFVDSNVTFIYGGGTAVLNYPQWAKINIVKSQKNQPNVLLEGAVFQIWTNIEGRDTLISEGTTDENGELTFENLEAGIEYRIVESKAPEGYSAGSAVITQVAGGNTVSLYQYRFTLAAKDNVTFAIQNGRSTGGGGGDPKDPKDPKDTGGTDEPGDTDDTGGSGDTGSTTVPGGTDQGRPPVPTVPGHSVVAGDNGIFVELDDMGVPLGEWHWDEDEGMWIFDEYPPLSDINLPKTGETGQINFVLIFIGLLIMFELAVLFGYSFKCARIKK